MNACMMWQFYSMFQIQSEMVLWGWQCRGTAGFEARHHPAELICDLSASLKAEGDTAFRNLYKVILLRSSEHINVIFEAEAVIYLKFEILELLRALRPPRRRSASV